MADLIDHDYEGAESVATLGYTNNSGPITNASGNGLGGSTWGLRVDNVSLSWRQTGSIAIATGHSGRGFSVSADFDHADMATDFGESALTLLHTNIATNDFYLQLFHGFYDLTDERENALWLVGDPGGVASPGVQWLSAADVLVPNTTQRLGLCGFLSSAANVADGSVSVLIDDVVVATVTGLVIGLRTGGTPAFATLKFVPMGRFDNLLVTDVGCGDIDTIALPASDSTPCCGDSTTPGGPGGVGATMPDNPFQALQAWASTCAGGGVVPTAADLTDSESWT